MSAPLLGLDSPAIRPSFFGGWLVDDGGIVPVRAGTWRAARAEAAARSSSSPPPGGPPASRFDADGRVAKRAGVAGLPDGQPSRGAVGHASGPSVASPGSAGPDAPSFSTHVGEDCMEGSAGVAACEAAVAPATSPSLPNGATQ